MSVSVWCEYVCTSCARVASGRHVYGSTIPTRAMRADAKKEGWVFTKDEPFCTEACRDRYTAENPPFKAS